MNRSKRIIAFIISWTFFAQILTTSVLADTNFKSFEATQSLEDQEGDVNLASEADNSEGKMEESVLDSVYDPSDIPDEFLDELPLEQAIPTDIKMLAEIPEDKLPIGDVDGNGTVNSLDFAYMRMHLLGMIDDFKPEDDLWVSDVTGDDLFNSIDFAFMRQFLLGKITEFPKQKLITSPTPTSVNTPTPTASETAVIVETPTPKPTETVVETPTPIVSDIPKTETPSPTPTSEPVAVEGQLRVEVKQTNEDSSGAISPNFKIYNMGDSTIELSKVKVRYYYTIDGESEQQFICDYSNVDAANVTGNFVKMQKINVTTNYYIEMGFTSAAGYISPNDCVEIQVRVQKTNWTNYNLTNDYSRCTSTDYAEWDLVTAYIDGNLQWGIEPDVYAPTPTPTPIPTPTPTKDPDKDDYVDSRAKASVPLVEDGLTYGVLEHNGDSDWFVFVPSNTGMYRFEGIKGVGNSKGYFYTFIPDENIYRGRTTLANNGGWYWEQYLYAGTKHYLQMTAYNEDSVPGPYSIKVTYLKPDFRIVSINPAAVCINMPVDFNVIVQNIGGDMVDGQSFVTALSLEGNDVVFSIDSSNLLAKNEYATINFTEVADNSEWDFSQKGAYKITATVDEQNTVDEMDELNNTLTKDFYVEDYGNSREDSTQIELGEKISGEMDYKGDCDYFAFTPDSDGNYVATLSNAENMLVDLYDRTGKRLKSVTREPLTLNYDLLARNTYYFKLSQNSEYLTEDYDFIVTKDDYGNDMNSAKSIKSGDKLSGKMDYKGDFDYFEFIPDSNGRYVAMLSDTDHMEITLYNGIGTRLGYTTPLNLSHDLVAGNKYFIKLSQDNDNYIGSYEFSFFKEEDGDSIYNAIAIGETNEISGYIYGINDKDYFSYMPKESGVYCIYTTGMDTSGELYFTNRTNPIAKNNDKSSEDKNFYIAAPMEADKIYFISVRGNEGAGNYTLKVERMNEDDFGNDASTAYEINTLSKVQGNFESTDDIDCFKYVPNSDGWHCIEIYASNSARLELWDDNARIDVKTINTEGRIGILRNLSAEKNYYLKVSSDYGKFGRYELEAYKDDYPSLITDAKNILVGDTVSAELECNTDVDYFKFTTEEAGIYLLESIGTTDVTLQLFDGQNESSSIGSYYNNGSDINFFAKVELLANTTYFTKIYQTASAVPGAYEYRVSKSSEADDYPNSFELAKSVDLSSNISGSINYLGDADFMLFTTDKSGIYSFSDSTSGGRLYFYLYDDNKDLILMNYYSINANVKLNADKKYYIKVNSYNSSEMPNYEIKVDISDLADDYGDDIDAAAELSENNEIAGYMDAVFDNDFFKFIPGKTAPFNITCETNSPIKAFLLDSTGKEIASVYRTSSPYNCNFARIFEEGKAYYVKLCYGSNYSSSKRYPYTIKVTSLIDDYGNTMENATFVELDKEITGQIDYDGDYDYFAFTPAKHASYGISIGVSGGSVYGRVYNSEGTSLYNNAITDSAKKGFIGMSLEANKTYYFAIEQNNNMATYSFSISEMMDDHGNSLESATSISVGDEVAGSIKSAGDEDFFRIKIPTAGEYRFETKGNTDTEGYIYDAYGNELFYDDASGDNYNFRIDQSFEGGKTYYVKVKHKNINGTGDYGIRITELYDDIGNSIQFSEVLKLNEEKSGTINYERDVDYFAFTPSSSGSYRIETTGTTDTNGIIYKSDGVKYSDVINNISTSNLNFFANIGLDANTTYYICIKANSATGLGGYGIKVKFLNDDHGYSFETATVVQSDTDASGEIQFLYDYDYFGFTPVNSSKYRLEIMGNSDANGYLYNNKSDQSGTYISKYIELQLTAGNTYYIRISGNLNYPIYKLRVLELIDDHGNTSKEATLIEVGSETIGKINYEGDIDYFKFTAPEDGIYHIVDTSSRYINGSCNGFTDYNNNAYDYMDLKVKLVKGKEYFVKLDMTSHYPAYTNYNLKVSLTSDIDDYADTKALAGEIFVDTDIVGEIDYAGDSDWMCFTVSEDAIFKITIPSNLNCYFYDESKLLESITYSSTYIEYPVIKDGKYYINLSGDDRNKTVAYKVNVLMLPMNDDYGNDRETAALIEADKAKSGRINYVGDIDCFQFTPDSSGIYTVETFGSIDTSGCIIEGSSEEEVSRNNPANDDGVDSNYSVTRYFDSGKTYYIGIHHAQLKGTGYYSIKVTSPPPSPATAVGGKITEDTVWDLERSPYIIRSDITIESGVTLTINPNVTVKTNPGLHINVLGKMNADGVTFTSSNDNGDLTSTISTSGYWTGIKTSGQINCDGSTIKYAKTGLYQTGSITNLTNSTISNCTIGIDVQGGTLSNICNNTLLSNQKPIYVNINSIGSGRLKTITDNAIGGSLNYNAIVLIGDKCSSPGVITNNNNRYIIECPYITSTLTIEPGITIKMNTAMKVEGSLVAKGTMESPIIFTNFYDPDNGVMNTASKWGGITVELTGVFNAENIKIMNSKGIVINGKLSLYNSEFYQCSDYAILFNTTYQPYVQFNSLYTNNGMYNKREDMIIDACYNYWNSPTGPCYYDAEAGSWLGNGSKVAGKIQFIPFLPIPYKMQEFKHFGRAGTNPATGNYSRSDTDLTLTLTGFDISINRTYNSKDNREKSTLGRGWSFGFEGSITDYDGSPYLKMVRYPNGSVETFPLNADGTYTANDSRNTLTKVDGTYVITTKDQYRYIFNSKGYLTYMKDRNDNTLKIEVDDSGNVEKVISGSRELTIEHNKDGMVQFVTDPRGRKVEYQYNDKKLLNKVIDPEGNSVTYEYDSYNYLSAIKDGYEKAVENIEYYHDSVENKHKVWKVTNAFGNVDTYTYNNAVRKTIIKDSKNRSTTHEYDQSMYIIKTTDAGNRSTITKYSDVGGINKYGEAQSSIDRNGNMTEYIRDDRGNIKKIINPDKSYREMEYDEKNNLIMEKDEKYKYTFYIYDADKKNLVKKAQYLKNAEEDEKIEFTEENGENFAITTYEYYTPQECKQFGYSGGLLRKVTDPEGKVTEYTYDEYGFAKEVIEKGLDAEQKLTMIFDYNEIGWQKSVTSPKGIKTNYEYDLNGNIIKTSTKMEDEREAVTRITYDANGQKTKEVSPELYDSSQEDAETGEYKGDHGYRYYYNDQGALERTIDPENNTTWYDYDIFGNVEYETKPDSNGNTELKGGIYVYGYDVLNRLNKISFKESETSDEIVLEDHSYNIFANGDTTKTVKKHYNATESSLKTYTYDYKGREISVSNPDGSTIKTHYNTNGTLNSTKDAMGGNVYYKYDGLNRLTDKWSAFEGDGLKPLCSYEKFIYDNAGNIKEEKKYKKLVVLYSEPQDDEFVTTVYDYYDNGKVKSITSSSGAITEYNDYDDDGNVTVQTAYRDSKNKTVSKYHYNNLGLKDTETVTISAKDIYGYDIDNTDELILETKYTYDLNGNLKTVTTPDKVVTTYYYDKLNRQTGRSIPCKDEYDVEMDNTVSTKFNYEGNPLTSTDGKGLTTTYYYNNRGLLEKTEDANKGITAYYYDRAGRLTAEVSPENYDANKILAEMNRTTYSYDKMDNIITQSYKGNEYKYNESKHTLEPVSVDIVQKAYKYDSNGNVTKSLDALGYEAGTGTTVADKINSGYGTEYMYNFANKLVSEIDAETKLRGLDYTTKYIYDGLGRMVEKTNARGVATKYQYDDAGNIESTVVRKKDTTEDTMQSATYDYLGNVLTETDGNKNVTVYEYNAFNQLRKVIYPGDESIPSSVVTYQYDLMGRVKAKTDSTGVELYDYDSMGRTLSKIRQELDGKDRISNTYKYDANGNVRFKTDGNLTKTEYEYNSLNKIRTQKVKVSGVLHTTTYDYDKNGNETIVTDWRGNKNTKFYDGLNRLIEEKDAEDKSIEKITYNHNNAQDTSYDALNNPTKYTYDRNNRLLTTTDAEKHSVSQEYDEVGNIAVKKDGNQKATQYIYEDYGRLESIINDKKEATIYTYDLNGNMLTMKDGKGNITTYEYNAANKLKRKIDHGGIDDSAKTVTYKYYDNGNVQEMLDRNGNTTEYDYDCHGRILLETNGDKSIGYTYDGNGNQLTVTADGKNTTTRTYDELGRVLTKDVPNIGKVEYTYDIIANVPQGYTAELSTDPLGNKTTKVYDRVGRIKYVKDGEISSELDLDPSKVTTYDYYDNGARKSVTYPSGVKEEYTYYADGLLNTLVNKKADGIVLDTYKYIYDGAHNQKTKEEYINGKNKGITSYTYDSLNRLDTVTEPTGKFTKYTYDASGNRKTEMVKQNGQTTSVYEYNEQNRLQGVKEINGEYVDEEPIDEQKIIQDISFVYDNNGNQTAVTVIQYVNGIAQAPETTNNEYDKFNQLIKTTSGDTIVENYYNGEGLREAKAVKGVLTRYLYEYDKVVLELDQEGNQTGRNIYGTNLLMRTVEDESYYYLYNGHADVTALVNAATGNIDATYYYDAFGNILEADGIAKDKNSVLYAGYQYDSETGLYYLNARMYDPKFARFLQEDTYTGDPNDPLSLNLYTYSHNNPIIYYDPTGHAINLIAGAIGAGAGFLIGAGSSMVVDAFKGEFSGKSWKKYLGAGVQGAVVGGAAGVTMGGSLVVMAATGAAAGAVGNVANQTIRNSGFKNFSVKELAISTIASGAGSGVAGATSNVTSSLTSQISSQALQKTAQGAAIGAASGATGGFTANVTDQVWDIATGEKQSFDVGSLAKDTFVGGALGAGIGGAFGYASSKYGAKVSELDAKLNDSIKQGASKFVESSKSLLNKLITDETGSIRIAPKGSTGGNANSIKNNVLNNLAESKAARVSSKFRSDFNNAGIDEVKLSPEPKISPRRQAALDKQRIAAQGSGGSGNTDFIVSRNGTAVHANQSEMIDSITNAGATKVGTARSGELGEIYRMNTPNGPMEIRAMEGKPGGGTNYGPRTITTREGTGSATGTGEYVHPNGARIEGPVPKSDRAGIGHTHGQRK